MNEDWLVQIIYLLELFIGGIWYVEIYFYCFII